ncbi:MAG TPA: hypothetical protein VN253_14055, partial [Kofleriaceae bacterium]|nr:hypothetical protein [Kofleriaceae bacterium]
MKLPHSSNMVLAAVLMAAGCVDTLDAGSVESAGMLNGMLNGIYHPEGLTAFLTAECPILRDRLLNTGGLDQPFPAAFAAEIATPTCEKFMFYTAELMVPYGQTLTLSIGNQIAASFQGAMGMQHLVAQVYPQYTFAQHAFAPAYPVARKVATQGYAALTNQIQRTVSYKTNVPAMDAHRAPAEDLWPREFTQIVPFTAQGLAAMASDPSFLAQQPDFFNTCNSQLTNYNYLREAPGGSPSSGCPVPVVVHGNSDYVNDVIPGRSCRILQ